MTPEQVAATLSDAEARGYRLRTRHQPAVELEDPDWIVVIEAPDGRVLFPDAVDDEEDKARRRAALRLVDDMRGAPVMDAAERVEHTGACPREARTHE